MKATEHRCPDDITHRSRIARLRGVPIKRLMRSRLVVVVDIFAKSPTQVRLAQRDDEVGALSANRSDHTLDKRVLPR